ncbi:hypothetical protein [Yinghuangia sp. YIM S09857]|uniref:hypothetical protein n=1 Tax=Yinghuangia sp. YIM S09857 TaxID=3436929 RepID=UPI003F52C612
MIELVTAMRLVEPEVAAALSERFRAEIEAIVEARVGLPRTAVTRIFAQDDFDVAGLLVEGWSGGPRADDLLMRAARLGDPAVAASLFRRNRAMDAALYAEVLAHVADEDDQGWHEPYGVVHALREIARRDPLAAATMPFSAAVRQAAADRCGDVPYAVAVDLCVAVADRCARTDLLDLAKEDLGHPGLAALLVDAAQAPEPSAYLADRRPPEEWLDAAAVRAFLGVRLATENPRSVEERPALDWDLVRREHARKPLDDAALGWLTSWEGCPEDLVHEALKARRPNIAFRHATWLPFDVVSHEGVLFGTDFADAMRRGISDGWLPLDRILGEAAPANHMLALLPETPEVRTALADLFAPFGDDPHLWLTFYSRLPRFAGSAVDLVAEVAASPTAKRTTTWPRPLAAVFPATEPENTRALFLHLLRLLPDSVVIALAPYFDARAVQHLLVYHYQALSPRARDALVAAHGVPALASRAACGLLTKEEVAELLALDEPAVDAALYVHARVPDTERARILAGLRTDGGRRRVAPEVVSALYELNLGHYRARLTAGIPGGDPGVATVILRCLRLGTQAGRLRLLAAVWERYGPAEVEELLNLDRLPATTVKTVRALLPAEDGLARLQDLLAAETSPEKVVAYLAKKAGRADENLRRAIQEGVPLPWPQLADAVRDGLFSRQMVDELCELPDCTNEFGRAALGVGARHGRPASLPNRSAVERMLRTGALVPEDLLHHGTSPAAFLDLISRDPTGAREGRGAEPCEAARALVAEHVGEDPDAWAVAVRLFPDFTGTLPQLLATARAAVA